LRQRGRRRVDEVAVDDVVGHDDRGIVPRADQEAARVEAGRARARIAGAVERKAVDRDNRVALDDGRDDRRVLTVADQMRRVVRDLALEVRGPAAAQQHVHAGREIDALETRAERDAVFDADLVAAVRDRGIHTVLDRRECAVRPDSDEGVRRRGGGKRKCDGAESRQAHLRRRRADVHAGFREAHGFFSGGWTRPLHSEKPVRDYSESKEPLVDPSR
jgi:hypothetical protein